VIHILRLLNVTWFHSCWSNSYRHSSPVVNSSRRSNTLRLIPLSLFVPSAKHLDVKILKKQASGWICLFLCVSVISTHTRTLSAALSLRICELLNEFLVETRVNQSKLYYTHCKAT
jgi:hypothetical protein